MPHEGPELWSVQQVAEHLGVKPTSARGTLSRWGIRAAEYAPRSGGGLEARFNAEHVRAAASCRPGRGARTDMRQAG